MSEEEVKSFRYPGIKPFSSEEQELFFGREHDIELLYTLVYVKKIVVVYGKSGYGKSSLINAGLIPKLKEEGSRIYFTIRFNNFSSKVDNESISPLETVKFRLKAALENDNGPASVLNSIFPGEDSFWYWIKQNQINKSCSKFILIFDQFEELFSYPPESIREFSEQLSELLYINVPANFQQRISEMEENNSITKDLYEWLNIRPDVKVVLTIRSDRLSLINRLSDRHPTILQNCFELKALNKEQAENAIIGPAIISNPDKFISPEFKYSPETVKRILDGVSNAYDDAVDIPTMQIICRYIESELVLQRQINLISSSELGNISKIVQQYYEKVLEKLDPNERKNAEHLIEDELLEGGRRNPLLEEYIQRRFEISTSLLLYLEATSLLRKERDASGRVLYELGHDSLIKPITIAREKRITCEAEERRKNELDEKRKLDERIELLHKSREQKNLNKKAFDIRRSMEIKQFYADQVKVIMKKENLRKSWTGIFVLIFVFFSIIWSIIATVKFINKDIAINAKSEQLELVNREFENFIKATHEKNLQPDVNDLQKIMKKYERLR